MLEYLGQNSIYTKRLLPVTPDENPRRMGSLSAVRNNQLSLDLNTDIEFDLMQRRLQDRLTFNENLMNKGKSYLSELCQLIRELGGDIQ